MDKELSYLTLYNILCITVCHICTTKSSYSFHYINFTFSDCCGKANYIIIIIFSICINWINSEMGLLSQTNIRVSTTNGLERQHYELKQNYLKNYKEGTITSLIKTITNHFLPDSYKR